MTRRVSASIAGLLLLGLQGTSHAGFLTDTDSSGNVYFADGSFFNRFGVDWGGINSSIADRQSSDGNMAIIKGGRVGDFPITSISADGEPITGGTLPNSQNALSYDLSSLNTAGGGDPTLTITGQALPVPEPASLALLGLGALGLAGYGWRKRKRDAEKPV